MLRDNEKRRKQQNIEKLTTILQDKDVMIDAQTIRKWSQDWRNQVLSPSKSFTKSSIKNDSAIKSTQHLEAEPLSENEVKLQIKAKNI